MNWDSIKLWCGNIIDTIWIAFLAVVGFTGSILCGGLAIVLIASALAVVILLAYAGKAIAITIVLAIVCVFVSLILYQDLSLFTIITNYLSQYL